MQYFPGKPAPLGSTITQHAGQDGVNFAVFSANAEKVELCLFDRQGKETRFALTRSDDIWHGFIAGIGAGTPYGYRVHGERNAEKGALFNPQKLLLDPRARAITHKPDLSSAEKCQLFLWEDDTDNGDIAPKALVCADEPFDWEEDRAPNIPWGETVIYEAHVKGFTKHHPDIPADIAGTYLGLAHPATIAHLKRLGITTLELLPISFSSDEAHLQRRGLVNYWGYNVLAHFAADPRFAAEGQGSPLSQVQRMVKALHRAGIEVIIDVVFNHTAEGDLDGQMLSWRGIDNQSYYWLTTEGHYENWSGCGNCINAAHPAVLEWILDCLRYWVKTCHVDGFRFDLASILGRTPAFSADAPFFQAIADDPLLSKVKLIAEPWDIGLGGYCVGQFPPPFAEWNGDFRDDMRRFFLHESGACNELAERMAASHDTFAHNHRPPSASVNFITAHDGFTLHDLVSYNHKHNAANGEDNRDGHNDNISYNHGAEGDTDDPAIITARNATARSLLAALILSSGTPMLLAGDEFGHSQQGNNNGYCQDNDITWLDWANADADLIAYTAALIHLRRQISLLSHDKRWKDEKVHWLSADGTVMDRNDWHNPQDKALQILLNDEWLLLINGQRTPRLFQLPDGEWQHVMGIRSLEEQAIFTISLETAQMEVCVLRRLHF